MASVLLVEDDEFFRIALKDVLQRNSFQITEAPDGRSAKSLLSLTQYDLIISDIQMPYLSGVELLNWVKEKFTTPFVLMTGFSQILETKAAFEMGADGFLTKPFSESELITTIQSLLKTNSDSAPPPAEEIQYCKIFIDDFIVGHQIPFNIYILLGEDRYVKIAHKGEDISLQKIKMYKDKNVRYLFIRMEDYTTLVGMNLKLTKSMAASSKIPMQVKKNFVKYTGEVILEKAFVDGVDSENFQIAKEFVQNSLQILSQDDDAFTTLKVLNEHSDYLYAHSLGVSTYAVLIAKKLGWNSVQTIFKVSLAGLFHDIGKKELDRSILDKPRVRLSQAEISTLEGHAQRGKEILESMRSVPTDVLQVALEHHENLLGSGYPRRLRRDKIHPFAKLISVANIFCNYAIKNPNSDGMSGKDALQKMSLNDSETIDLEYFAALGSLF